MNFFQWTTRDGQTIFSQDAPNRENSNFEEINELVFLRPEMYFEKEREKIIQKKGSIGLGEIACLKNQPVPCHNNFCQNGEFPPNLTIFRANDCRLWYWPKFPESVIEIEMKNSCLIKIPDLSYLKACTILILNNGILEDVIGPLPPKLEVLDLASCAINKWTLGNKIPGTLGHIFFEGNPSNARIVVPDEIQYRFVQPNQKKKQMRINDLLRLNDLLKHNKHIKLDNLVDIETNVDIDYNLYEFNQPRTFVQPKHIVYNPQNVHESGFQESTRKNIEYILKYRLNRLKPMSENTHNQKLVVKNGQVIKQSVWRYYCTWLENVVTKKTNELSENPLNIIETTIKTLEKKSSISQQFIKNPTAEEVFKYLDNSKTGKILMTFMSTPYSLFGHSFIEIAIRVCEKILDIDPEKEGEKRRQLLQRLSEEVEEGKDFCTNGMIVRLTNVFLGFDENIEMVASPATVLGGRIPILLKKIRSEGNWEEGSEPSEYWKKVIEEILKDMRQMELDKTKWNDWIEDFINSYKEELDKEGKISHSSTIKMTEDDLKNLEIKDIFLEDQIRIWAGIGEFQ